jgi:mRNA-degrading endonuclease toxin of MazEF toxin-antitoxin module
MNRPRAKRTVFVVPLKRCQHCGGSGWRPVTVLSRGLATRRVTRCVCIRILRTGETMATPKTLPPDGKMLALGGSGE